MPQGSLKLYTFGYPKFASGKKFSLHGFLEENEVFEIESVAVFAEGTEEARGLIFQSFDVFPNLARCIKQGTFENMDEAVITIEKGNRYATRYRVLVGTKK